MKIKENKIVYTGLGFCHTDDKERDSRPSERGVVSVLGGAKAGGFNGLMHCRMTDYKRRKPVLWHAIQGKMMMDIPSHNIRGSWYTDRYIRNTRRSIEPEFQGDYDAQFRPSHDAAQRPKTVKPQAGISPWKREKRVPVIVRK